MTPQPNPGPQWLELRNHLEWTRGFAPVFVFFPPNGNPRRGRAYLDEALKSRQSDLLVILPEKPEDASRLVLSALLDEDAMRAAVWVELLRGETNPAWQQARSETLAMLNERRDLLEREFERPLILVLPCAFAETAARSAPDLWSKRLLALFPADAVIPQTPAEAAPEPSLPSAIAPSAELAEWLKTWQTQRALPDPRQASLYEGAMAADALLEAYRWDEAHEVASGLVAVARAALSKDKTSAFGLRNLSIALNKLGEAESALGRPETARDAFCESLEISRALRLITHDAPQALRDLSVSLGRVGSVEQALGRLDDALNAYRESLEISRALRLTTHDAPQALRDLSVSLEKVGGVEQALGRLDEALNAYRESLEIRRALRLITHDAPQALRDLSVSLDNVGGVEQALGRLDDALNAYRESLEIFRRLHTDLGDLPQVLNDLRIVLTRLAQAERQAGDNETAVRLEREAAGLMTRRA